MAWARAPRQARRGWPRRARGAWLATGFWLVASSIGAHASCAPIIPETAMADSAAIAPLGTIPLAAWYEDPTTRYAHGVLGDAIEAETLALRLPRAMGCAIARLTLPPEEVFEDLAPRLVDLTADGHAEVIVVQSHARLGARLAIYGLTADGTALTLYGATPNIGRPNRWLAPIGAADLDGDGRFEIAFIDRPHLARTLRIWRVDPTGPTTLTLTEIASQTGLSNHRIGEAFITGGIRDCGTGPDLLTADATWQSIMATRLSATGLETRRLAPFSVAAMARALDCRA